MLKAVLFDMGDTLLRRPPDRAALARVTNDSLHATIRARYPGVILPPPDEFHEIISVTLKRLEPPIYTRDEIFTLLVAEHGWTFDPHDPELLTAWHRPLLESSSMEPDLPATLDALRAQGLRLGVVSNTGWRRPWRDRELAYVGIQDYFPVRVYSSDLRVEKPDPRIFAAALAAWGDVAPGEALYVGDHLAGDVGGAHGAGLRAALLAPAGPPPLPASGPLVPDLVLAALGELPAALAARPF